MEKREVNLEFDSRLFELLAKDLYKDKLSFLRELTQNSFDAQATVIEWILDEDNHTLEERENGKGMNYEFLVSDFKKLGKAFKTDNQDLGFYGIGRLSIWLVSSKAEIQTNDALLTWNSIDKYEVERKGYHQGLTFKLFLKENLDTWELKHYLKENIILPITIKLNGEEIKPNALNYRFKVSLPSERATVYINPITSKYADYIKIFEKGLLVKDSWNSYISSIINYDKPIKTLSRESLTITDTYIKQTLLKALIQLFKDISLSERETLLKSVTWLACEQDSEELAELIVFEGKQLKDYKGYYYSKPSALVSRAREKGYNVLVSDSDNLLACCRLVGLESLEVLKEELKETYFHKACKDIKGKRLLLKGANYLDMLVELTKEIKEKYSKEGQGSLVKDSSLAEIERTIKDMDNSLVRDNLEFEEGHGEFTFIYGNIGFGYHDNPNITAWRVLDKIALNLNNELVQTVIETQRFDLLEETLLHEFVHRLGLNYHDDNFTSTYNAFRHEILLRRAREISLFSTKVQVSSIEGKYIQGLIKLPKEVLTSLELGKGTQVKVTIESLKDN